MAKFIELSVQGESITYGGGSGPWTYNPDAFLHFGIFPESEAENIAHNLAAVFGVRVKMDNHNGEITIYGA